MKKSFFLILIIVVVLVGIYLVFVKKYCDSRISTFKTIVLTCQTLFEKYRDSRFLVPPTPQGTPADEVTDWKTYRNEEYGFEITFTDAWKGYQVESQPMGSNFGAGTLVFKILTTKNYGDGSGYAKPLKIYIYNHEYWSKLQKENGPKPGFLGRTQEYVFAYSTWQDPPAEFVGKDFGFDKVVASFKLDKSVSVVGLLCGGEPKSIVYTSQDGKYFSKVPVGIVDGPSFYYDMNGVEVAACSGFGPLEFQSAECKDFYSKRVEFSYENLCVNQ